MRRRKLDERFLASIRLEPGQLVVDCGASVGDVVAVAVARGARVIAFEPHPAAFAALARRFAGSPQVTCIEKAVLDRDGSAALYRHRDLDDDPETLKTANGSSLLPFKGNVSCDDPLEIETIDLAAFLRGLGERPRVLKIDIEGAEIEVLNHLLDSGAHALADLILVETHDHKIPELRAATEALRKRIDALGVEHIRLDWH